MIPSVGKPLPCGTPDYRQGRRKCTTCDSLVACKLATARWETRLSLAERLAALERTFEPSPTEDIQQTYRRVHRQMFGRESYYRMRKRNRAAFDWVERLCAKCGIEPELYIRAQMYSMSFWLNDPVQNPRRLGFLPTMMTGSGAKRRYNIYLRFRYREFRNVYRPAFSTETYEGRLRSFAYEDELSLGTDYTNGVYSHMPVDFSVVVQQESPSSSWWAIMGEAIPADMAHAETLRSKLVGLYGLEWIARVRELIRLRAACEVAESFKHGLADRVGFKGSFLWSSFAQLVLRAVPRREPRLSEDLSDVPGILYGQ